MRASRAVGLLLGMGCWFVLSGVVWAANSIVLKKAEAFATISQIGLTVMTGGDDNGNAKVGVRYRVVGASAWVVGHPLLKSTGGRYLGSLFRLQAGRKIDIEILFQDPDGAPAPFKMQAETRADAPATPKGRHLYVSPNGKDANAGSKAAPWATLQKAADQAKAGDTIHVLPGIYRESLEIRKSGEPGNPIVFVAEGSGVVLDGSEPTLTKGASWKDEGQGIYSVPFSKASLYVAVDDLRLYDYQKRANFDVENGKQSGKNGIVKGGFFVDSSAKRLFVRLPDRSAPGKHAIHVAVRDVGIRLETVHDVVIRGFEIRYYGGTEYGSVGIDVRNSSRCWLQKNSIHHLGSGIVVRKTVVASHNVIEDNVLRDTSVWTWDWSSVKAKTAEASAISITHGRGNVVRRNRMEGFFNGIYVGSFSDKDEDIAQDTDILDNQLSHHGDDGLEPEGACINVRFLGNRIDGVHNGVSLAPIIVGPVWAIRNVINGFKAHALKLNNGSTGWMVFYHTTALPSAQIPGAQAMAPSIPFGFLLTRNNIWGSNRYVIEYGATGLKGPIDLDYDLVWSARPAGEPWFKWKNVRYSDLAAFAKGTGMERHGVAGKPLFENEAKGDLRPGAGAPMLDVGVWIDGVNRVGTLGAAPDLGAYERGGSQPPKEPQSEPKGEPVVVEHPQSESGPSELPLVDRQVPGPDAGAHADDRKRDGAGSPPERSGQVDSVSKDRLVSGDVGGKNGDRGEPGVDGAVKGGCQCQAGDASGFWMALFLWLGLLGFIRKSRQPQSL